MIQKLLLLAAVLAGSHVFAFGDATAAQAHEVGLSVAMGYDENCVLWPNHFGCWGPRLDGVEGPGVLVEKDLGGVPTQITTGKFQTCALINGNVQCWGTSKDGNLTVPKLDHPTLISSGYSFTCALDRGGVKCWGKNCSEQQKDCKPFDDYVPKLENPYLVGSGLGVACSLSDDGLVCWADYGAQVLVEASEFKNARQISTGESHVCVIDDHGLRCWEWFSGQFNSQYYKLKPVTLPEFKGVKQVGSSSYHACALDSVGVKCFVPGDNINPDLAPKVPELDHPVSLSVGAWQMCVLERSGRVNCFGGMGDYNGHSFYPPDSLTSGDVGVNFELASLDRQLERASNGLYLYKRDFLLAGARVLRSREFSPAERYFVLAAIGPVLEVTSTRRMREFILPVYRHALAEAGAKLHLNGLATVPKTPATLAAAVALAHAAWEGSRSYLVTDADQKEVSEAIRELGTAAGEAKRLGSFFEARAKLIGTLAGDERTSGFGAVLASLRYWATH